MTPRLEQTRGSDQPEAAAAAAAFGVERWAIRRRRFNAKKFVRGGNIYV